MENFYSVFNDFDFTEKTNKPISVFSNWIYSISVGFCTILIFKLPDINTFEVPLKFCIKPLVILSMINCLYVSFVKYYILIRDINMASRQGVLSKIIKLGTNKDKDEVKQEWDKEYEKWISEYNKIKSMGRLLNISIFSTSLIVIMTGIIIVMTV